MCNLIIAASLNHRPHIMEQNPYTQPVPNEAHFDGRLFTLSINNKLYISITFWSGHWYRLRGSVLYTSSSSTT